MHTNNNNETKARAGQLNGNKNPRRMANCSRRSRDSYWIVNFQRRRSGDFDSESSEDPAFLFRERKGEREAKRSQAAKTSAKREQGGILN